MGKRSLVWNYFNSEAELGIYSCNVCNKHVKAMDSSTSNLRHHIRMYHPHEHMLLNPVKPDTVTIMTLPSEMPSTASVSSVRPIAPKVCIQAVGLAELFGTNMPNNRSDKRWEDLTSAITFCIAKDMMPLKTVEKPGFRHLLKKMEPLYDPPSEYAISNTHIPKLYKETQDKVLARLKEVVYFSATTDMWSSHGMTPYMGFSIHFIDKQWKLNHVDLGIRFLPTVHTSETIAEAMEDMLEQWGLSPFNLVCVTTDNGADVVKSIKELGWQHMPCFGHNLHLGIKQSYSSDTQYKYIHQKVSRSLDVAHTLVAKFHTSWKKTKDLQTAQVENGKDPKCLISDCGTNWISTQAMIKRILDNEDEIKQVIVNDRKTAHLVPSWQDIATFEALNKVMEPLAELTDILSGSTYVTISCLKPMLDQLEKEVLAPEFPPGESDPKGLLVNQLRRSILDDILDRYIADDRQEIINITSFLDPRFKATHLTEDDQLTSVKNALLRYYSEELKLSQPSMSSTSSAIVCFVKTENDPPPPKKRRSLGSWLAKGRTDQHFTQTQAAQRTPRDKLIRELELYTAMPCIHCEDDPLEWWKDHAKDFSKMAPYARRYLSIQATSSPSERLFNKADHIITPKAQLNSEKADMMVFLAQNL